MLFYEVLKSTLGQGQLQERERGMVALGVKVSGGAALSKNL